MTSSQTNKTMNSYGINSLKIRLQDKGIIYGNKILNIKAAYSLNIMRSKILSVSGQFLKMKSFAATLKQLSGILTSSTEG